MRPFLEGAMLSRLQRQITPPLGDQTWAAPRRRQIRTTFSASR